MRIPVSSLLVVVALAGVVVPASASMITPDNPLFYDPYNPALSPLDTFYWPLEIFTNNGAYADDPGVDIYFVLSNGNEWANFTFHNDSTVQSSLTRTYYDDGSLLGICAVETSEGVFFSEDGVPQNLPGGNMLDPPFDAIRSFNSDADPPLYHNGVNDGGIEWLRIGFCLEGGQSYFDVQNELIAQTLRVGIHIQGFPDGSSESGVTPEPATLMLLALGGLLAIRRRRP